MSDYCPECTAVGPLDRRRQCMNCGTIWEEPADQTEQADGGLTEADDFATVLDDIAADDWPRADMVTEARRVLTEHGRSPLKATPTSAPALREALEELGQHIWDGDLHIDGGDFQETMVKHRLWVEVEADAGFREEHDHDRMFVWAWHPLALATPDTEQEPKCKRCDDRHWIIEGIPAEPGDTPIPEQVPCPDCYDEWLADTEQEEDDG